MKTIAAVVDDIYEDLELWYPRLRLEEEGWKVVVAGPAAGKTYTGKHGYPCRSDVAFSDLRAGDFDGLLVPGGFAPDKIRRDARVLGLTREMRRCGKARRVHLPRGVGADIGGHPRGKAGNQHGGHPRRHGQRGGAVGGLAPGRGREPRQLAHARRPSAVRKRHGGLADRALRSGHENAPVVPGRCRGCSAIYFARGMLMAPLNMCRGMNDFSVPSA